jgi:hypothetical protein
MNSEEKKLLEELQSDSTDEEGEEALNEISFGKGINKKVILTTRGYTLKNIVELSK